MQFSRRRRWQHRTIKHNFLQHLIVCHFPFSLPLFYNTCRVYNTRLVCVTRRNGFLVERNTSCRTTASCVTFTSATKHDLVIIKLSTDRKDFPTRSSPTISNFCFRSKICDDTQKAKMRGRPSCHTCAHTVASTAMRLYATDDCREFSIS